MTKALTVKFHDTELVTAKAKDVIFVALRPISDALGLVWSTQTRKINSASEKFRCVHMNIPSSGGVQNMLCIPLNKLNGWLFSINPAKVKADLRQKVIQYQDECFQALHDYWFTGKAERPTKSEQTSTLDRTPLRDAVNMLVAKRSLNYPEAYGMVHQRFGIKSFEELTKDQLPAAIEYVHRLCIEGELLPKQPAVTGLTVTLPAGERFGRYLVVIDDGKASLVDANNKALIDIQVARQLANEAGAVAAYIESKAEQRDLEAKLLREESRRLRIFMGEESKSRLDKPLAEIFSV